MAPPDLATIAMEIFQGAISNIVQDVLVDLHRDHKMMLMDLDPTTKLPHCDRCNLPRLLDPPLANAVRGAASDPPADTVYCDKKPWCRRSGFDIYGNPFLKADLTGRPPTKKEREAAKNGNKKDDGTPASNEGGDANGTGPPSPSAEDGANAKNDKVEKGEKKALKIDEKLKKGEYIPWQTCPNCKRSLLITRFAKHLEQCMGLSGRAASRNAMAKMNGNTPAGSRGGTPGPGGSQGDSRAGADEDEDEDEKIKGPGGVRKKVLKKGLTSKLKKAEKDGKANGKVVKSASSVVGENGKRDRDEMSLGDDADEEESVHVKKRQKLQRMESVASFASQSSAQPGSAVEEDGSFIDDAASFAAEE